MIRVLPFLIETILLVWCLVEAITTPPHLVRNLDKTLWILLIIFVPLVGGIAWLVAGRPVNSRPKELWRAGSGFPASERPGSYHRGPDDDPGYLRSINTEHESTLRKWEADLKAREEQLRKQKDAPSGEAD